MLWKLLLMLILAIVYFFLYSFFLCHKFLGKYLIKEKAPSEDRTRGLSLTKRTQYHYAMEATVHINNSYRFSFYVFIFLKFLKYLIKEKKAPSEDRTRDLSLTKRTQYHYAMEAVIDISQLSFYFLYICLFF